MKIAGYIIVSFILSIGISWVLGIILVGLLCNGFGPLWLCSLHGGIIYFVPLIIFAISFIKIMKFLYKLQ